MPVVATMVAALALGAMLFAFQRGRDAAADTLRAVAELRLTQVDGWLRERTRLAVLTGSRPDLVELFQAWRQQGDAGALLRLHDRLETLRSAGDGNEAFVLDTAGHPQLPAGHALPAVLDPLRLATLRALATGLPQNTSIYRAQADRPPVLLDIVVPLALPGQSPVAALVLRHDPRRTLFPLMDHWPVPSRTGSTALWQLQAQQVLALSDLPGHADAAGRLQRPLATPGMPAAQVLRGEQAPDSVIEGVDLTGARVLSTAERVPGTDWLLVVMLERREVDAAAWRTAGWISGLAAALLLALLASARALSRRQALMHAEAEHQRQAAQLQALQLLEVIAENSSDAIFAKDLQGRYLFYNRAAAADVNRTPEQVIGLDDFALFEPAVAEQLRANDSTALQQGLQQRFEERFETRDGSRVYLVTKGPLRDARGQVIGLFGVSRDMTDQRRAEQALRDSEAHHRTVIDVLGEGVVVFDGQGRLVSANPAAERLLGAAAGALGSSKVDIAGWVPLGADGQPMPAAELPVLRVLVGRQPLLNVEYRARGPDGQQRWFSVNAQPVFEASGDRVRAVVASFTDITERQQMLAELDLHRHHLLQRVDERTAELRAVNHQLAAAEHLVRTVTDNIPGRVAYWDQDLRCRFANRAFHDWFGLASEQALGCHVSEVAGPDYAVQIQPRLQAALAGQAQRFERATTHPDGQHQVHLVHCLPDRHDDGQIRGVFVMAFDVTALKDAEAELLLQRDRAEAANQAKSAFLANMSHEIRTPMNAIIGLAHLVQRDTQDALQRDRMGKIGNAARHLLQIINDILDLSKIEAGRLELEHMPFSLDGVLARSFELVAERARDKGLELIVDTDHLPDHLVGDATRLQQALLNLLSNAVKFTDRGWVRLLGERLAQDGDRLQVRFSVSDTGPGIPQDRQGTLFTAFQQLDSSTSRRFGGTGLGLALTQRLAALMGGEVGLESKPGEGSCFWFSAWLHVGQPAAPERPVLAGRRVLLVDDLPEARLAIGERLRIFGLRVDEAGSGDQAEQLMQQAQAAGELHDALLIDWRMTPLDGIQTLTRLRELLGERLPPALLVTAYDDAEVRRQAREARFADVLVKPVTASTLHDALQQLLSPHGLPAAEAARPGTAEQTLRNRHAGTRVLLVEDNPINQEVALALLRSAGLQVDLAADGHQAMALAFEAPYALVLMDLQMPGLDGLSAARELRRLHFAAPIVAMTANAYGEDRAACLQAGMNDHVAKPVDPDKLFSALLRWLPEPGQSTPRVSAEPAPIGIPDPAEPASRSPGRPLLQRLADLPGFDPVVADRSAVGQPELLVRLLQTFAQHYAAGVPALDQAGGDERLAVWRPAVHSIKGACGAIGATALHAQAQALEQQLRQASTAAPCEQACASLNTQLQALSARLAQLLAE